MHRSRRSIRGWLIPSTVGAVLLLVGTGLAAAIGAPATAAAATWSPTAAITAAPGAAPSFSAPTAVRYTRSGALLVADFAGNGVVRRDPDGSWSVVAPFGTDDRSMWNPSALVEADDGRILVAEAGRRPVPGGPGTIAVIAGNDVVRRFPGPSSRAVSELAVDGARLFATVPGSGALWEADTSAADPVWTVVDGPWTDPAGVALSPDGSVLTVADGTTDGVWQVDRRTGTVSALGAVRDDRDRVRLRGVALLADGSVVVADNGGGRVWVRQDGAWTVAFSGAPDGSPLVNPTGVTVGPGDRIAVADYNQRRVVEAERVGGVEPSAGVTATAVPVPSVSPSVPVPSVSPSVPVPVPSVSPSVPVPVPVPSVGVPTPSVGVPSPSPSPSPTPTDGPSAPSPVDRSPEAGSGTPAGPTPGGGSDPGASRSPVIARDPAAARRTLASTGAAGSLGLLALASAAAITAGVLLRRTTRSTSRRH
jgi:hypothetical protein